MRSIDRDEELPLIWSSHNVKQEGDGSLARGMGIVGHLSI